MEEIEVKDNSLGIKVYVNGIPDINKMPEKLASTSVFMA